MPLTPEQQIGLEALLTTRTRDEAARKAKIGRSTLFRWLNEPEFSQAYTDACNKKHEHAIAAHQIAHEEATITLQEALKSENEAIAVRAAAVLVDAGFRAAEFGAVKEIRKMREEFNAWKQSHQRDGGTAGAVQPGGDEPASDVVPLSAG